MTITSIPVKSPQELALILSALQREKRLLEWEIQQTQERLDEFEKQNNMTSLDFYKKYEAGELGDDDSIMKWAGEYQLYLRFQNKLSRLKELISECQRATPS